MPLMAIEKPEPPKAPMWSVVVAIVLIFVVGLIVLTGIGYGIYYVADLICVAADPANASAVCQDVRG